MTALKLAAVFSDKSTAESVAGEVSGHLMVSNKEETGHLPFAALLLCVTDDLDYISSRADTGVYLVCERTIRHQPLDGLRTNELPGVVGIFSMVANPELGARAADQHWRDRHAPLALEIHEAMTHYYQLSVLHRFDGPDWNGFALCCFATEDDLRYRFFNSKEGEKRINADVSHFADTGASPRRVIATIQSCG